jgi:hypothetical protein
MRGICTTCWLLMRRNLVAAGELGRHCDSRFNVTAMRWSSIASMADALSRLKTSRK